MSTDNPERVSFAHFRRVRNGHKQIALTLAIQDGEKESLVGMAAVSECDNGSREKGRRRAAGRLEALRAGASIDWGFRVPKDRVTDLIKELRALEDQNLIFGDDNSINRDLMQDYVDYSIPGALPHGAFAA